MDATLMDAAIAITAFALWTAIIHLAVLVHVWAWATIRWLIKRTKEL